jgi:hypothetical protein
MRGPGGQLQRRDLAAGRGPGGARLNSFLNQKCVRPVTASLATKRAKAEKVIAEFAADLKAEQAKTEKAIAALGRHGVETIRQLTSSLPRDWLANSEASRPLRLDMQLKHVSAVAS